MLAAFTVKTSLQGLLIYLTMGLLLVGALLFLLRRRRLAWSAYAAAFAAAVASIVWRGLHTGHPPMQNLFEVFLVLSALLWPVSALALRMAGLRQEWLDCMLAAVVLVPAGFVFSEEVQELPPALQSPLFVPHVLAYLLSYVLVTKAAFASVGAWLGRAKSAGARAADGLASAGLAFMTTGLVLGAWWGKLAWGDWWNWDPKEMWSLAAWLVLVGTFQLRLLRPDGLARLRTVLLLLVLLLVLITLTWANLSRAFSGLHSYA